MAPSSDVAPPAVLHQVVDELANALQIIASISTLVRPTLEENGDDRQARALSAGVLWANAALARLRGLISDAGGHEAQDRR